LLYVIGFLLDLKYNTYWEILNIYEFT
jgi:hypothetical protein